MSENNSNYTNQIRESNNIENPEIKKICTKIHNAISEYKLKKPKPDPKILAEQQEEWHKLEAEIEAQAKAEMPHKKEVGECEIIYDADYVGGDIVEFGGRDILIELLDNNNSLSDVYNNDNFSEKEIIEEGTTNQLFVQSKEIKLSNQFQIIKKALPPFPVVPDFSEFESQKTTVDKETSELPVKQIIPSQKKHNMFTEDEDKLLCKLMVSYNATKELLWAGITANFPGKTSRQVRDRWKNYISASNKKPFSAEEDELLNELVRKYGTKWNQFTNYFFDRTWLQLKNRYNSISRNNSSPTLESYKSCTWQW